MVAFEKRQAAKKAIGTESKQPTAESSDAAAAPAAVGPQPGPTRDEMTPEEHRRRSIAYQATRNNRYVALRFAVVSATLTCFGFQICARVCNGCWSITRNG